MQGTRKDEQYKKWGIIGDNGCGKTGFILNKLILPAYDLKVHKILFIVQTNPQALKGITRLKTYDDLKRFEAGIAMFWDYSIPTVQMLENIAAILNEGQTNLTEHPRKTNTHYLHNGAIIFDDCSNYISANPPQVITEFLGNYRMFHLDLFFVAHTFIDFPSKMRRRMNYYTIFPTLERLTEKKFISLEYPNAEALAEEWAALVKGGNKFANTTIRTGML